MTFAQPTTDIDESQLICGQVSFSLASIFAMAQAALTAEPPEN
jgi:hypothetical protein